MAKMTIPVGEGGGWEPLPEGDFNFTIEDKEERTSSNGNPQLMLKMRVLDGPLADKVATNFLTITAKAAFRTKQLLEAAGVKYDVEGKDADGNELISFESDDLLNKNVTYKVKQREYEGKLNNSFDNPRPYGAGAAAAQAAPAGAPATAAPTGAAPPARGYPGAGATPPVDRRPRG